MLTSLMNMSHVINEFSFGPYFPDITQPLDHSLEITQDPFVAYQYFLSVVPTTYIAPRTKPLRTNQYSVTHYTRVLEHNKGTPGIFFKFDLEPLSLTIHQRTTTFLQFLIRCVGVVGGVWCCMGWAIRVGYKAVEVASGADKTPGIVAAEASGAKRKWGGGELRSRVTRQGSGWVVEGGSPYGSYASTPVVPAFAPASPSLRNDSVSPVPSFGPAIGNGHGNGAANGGHGLGLGSPSFGPAPSASSGHRRVSSISVAQGAPGSPSFPTGATAGSPYGGSNPGSPYFPPTPNTNVSGFPSSPAPGAGFPRSPVPGSPAFGPPKRESSLRNASRDGKKSD